MNIFDKKYHKFVMSWQKIVVFQQFEEIRHKLIHCAIICSF